MKIIFAIYVWWLFLFSFYDIHKFDRFVLWRYRINQEFIVSSRKWKIISSNSTSVTTMRFRVENERHECIRGDVSDENLDSVNFPVDGFPRWRVPGAGPQRGREQRENATRDSLFRSVPCSTSPFVPETPLRCVQNYCWLKALSNSSLKSRAASRRRSRWNCIWRFGLQREKGRGWRRGCVALAFLRIVTRPSRPNSVTIRWTRW